MQIVKGWVDAGGQSHEKVFDVAGVPTNEAVDTTTCAPLTTGADSLCAVWSDPEFDPSERAFYYLRVVEVPTCRWSTIHCNAQGIDCAGSVPPEWAECCNAAVPKTIRERAWSSPIWYRPEGVSRVRGKLRLREAPDLDALTLGIDLGTWPADFDFATQALTVTLRDDDVVYTATIPAGTLQPTGAGRWAFADAAGSIGGIRRLSVRRRASGVASLRLRTVPIDLAGADAGTHFIEVSLAAGATEITTTPPWTSTGTTLVTRF